MSISIRTYINVLLYTQKGIGAEVVTFKKDFSRTQRYIRKVKKKINFKAAWGTDTFF